MADGKLTNPLMKRAPALLAVGLVIMTGILAAAFFFRPEPKPQPRETDPVIARNLERLHAVTATLYQDESRLAALRFEMETPTGPDEMDTLRARIQSQRAAAAQLWLDLGALLELAPPSDDPNQLVRFPSEPIEQGNYNQVYHPILGPQPKKMPSGFSFQFDRVIPQADGSLLHRLDARAGGAIKWERELGRARTQGHYMVEATINRVWPGVVYAPLWLFAEGPEAWGHEYDFELVNGVLEFNLHNGDGGFNMHRVEKDLAGHRVRYEITRRTGKVTMRATSLTDGWREEIVITPEKVKQWALQEDAPENLIFPPDTIAMFPVIELWRCRWPEWCGKWEDLPSGAYVDMVVHGYRIEP